jgi:phage shock protein PspC (stress-responsive transcriptional regulator)
MINKISAYFEKQTFGVCAWWGDKLQLKSSRIRMFFIYLSFLTFGSPIFIYLIMAFILEHKEYFKFKKRKSVWDV